MKTSSKLNILLLLILGLNLFTTKQTIHASEPAPSHSKKYIPVIVQRESPYWEAISKGIQKAAKEFGVNAVVEAPKAPTPAALDEQIDLFEQALAESPSSIILSALDTTAFTPYLEDAKNADIPVIGLDSDVTSPIVRTVIATDNYGAGELAAHKMADLIEKKGKVGLLNHRIGIKSAADRQEGFINTIIQNYPDIEILPVQYGTGTIASLEKGAKTLLTKYPDIKGMLGTNRDATEVLINTAKELGKVKDLEIIGFDASQLISDAIKSGTLAGAIAQDPVSMGYKAIEAAIKASKGERLPTFIDTGFFWYDKSNIDTPEIQALLYK